MNKTSRQQRASLEEVDLYSFFRRLLERPGTQPDSLVTNELLPVTLASIAEHLKLPSFELPQVPADPQEAESRYLSLFEVGLPAPPCPLNEAPYVRTQPPTKIIHENQLFYQAFGLTLDEGNTELPDHISNQLEFLSFLTSLHEAAPDEDRRLPIRAAKRDFMERHVLSWIGQARGKLEEAGEPLYCSIFALLEAFLRTDLPVEEASPAEAAIETQAGTVVAISVSEAKGTPKSNVGTARLVEDWGIEGDAHAGRWHRQVSLLATESVAKMRAKGVNVEPGGFGENITTALVDIPNLQVGNRVTIGQAELEITQIGKECHSRCAIFEAAGDCVMPKEGIFARVSRGGEIRPGDPVRIITAEAPSTLHTPKS